MAADSIGQLLAQATQSLTALPDPQPRFEAELLLGHVLGCSRSHLFAFPEKSVAVTSSQQFLALVERRKAGEPIAYLTGQRNFHAITLKVTPDVLIPRADTELLVDTAINLLQNQQTPRILDLGTGSGAIALALANAKAEAMITATDASLPALRLAEENQQALALNSVTFLHGNWFNALPKEAARFNLIVSNPPYIAEADVHLQRGDVRFEPRQALVSGTHGLDDIRIITDQARHWLSPAGWLLLEHGFEQATLVQSLLKQSGYQNIKSLRDLAGHLRLTLGQLAK